MLFESHESLKNNVNYRTNINLANNSLTGVNETFQFNEVPSYHVTINSICDFMHDITKEVCRYDMALIIKNLIDYNFISLEILNNCIELIDYGMTENKIFLQK